MAKLQKNLIFFILLIVVFAIVSGCGRKEETHPLPLSRGELAAEQPAVEKNSEVGETHPLPLSRGELATSSSEITETATSTEESASGGEEIDTSEWKVYKNEAWYNDFINKITQIDRINSFDFKCTQYSKNGEPLLQPIKIDCVSGKIKKDDIADLFYLKDQNLAIALVSGIYGGSGFKLLRYDIKNKKLDIATREDADGGNKTSWYKERDKSMDSAPEQKQDIYLWFGTPDKITSYANGQLELFGSTGDAGCWQDNTFLYDIQKNYIYITKQCSGCIEKKETCVNF